MSETLTPEARDARRAERRHHQRRIQLGGVAVVGAVVLGVVLWLVLGGSGGSKPAQSVAISPVKLSEQGLLTLGRAVPTPIYWVGPIRGRSYELTRSSDGKVYVRYLPKNAKAGASGLYLTVGTYPFRGAAAALRKIAKSDPSLVIKGPNGIVAVVDGKSAKSVHIAYPGSDYQIELFDPSAAGARRLVSSGKVARVR
jgi:hypothetical protein